MKKYFVAGLIILLPITLTVILFLFVIDLFTEPFLDYARELLLHFPQSRFLVSSPELLSTISRLIILCLLAAFILVLGVIARWFFFQNLVNWTQKTFLKIPFVKTIYKILKEVMQAFFSQGGEKVFKCPALVPFPSKKKPLHRVYHRKSPSYL